MLLLSILFEILTFNGYLLLLLSRYPIMCRIEFNQTIVIWHICYWFGTLKLLFYCFGESIKSKIERCERMFQMSLSKYKLL